MEKYVGKYANKPANTKKTKNKKKTILIILLVVLSLILALLIGGVIYYNSVLNQINRIIYHITNLAENFIFQLRQTLRRTQNLCFNVL